MWPTCQVSRCTSLWSAHVQAIEVTIQNLIGSGMDPKTENNPYLGFIYTSFQVDQRPVVTVLVQRICKGLIAVQPHG